ncbi:MAG: L-lactate permease [Eggerthellaceae bacterium]|nr:L-lactate permease [Eggerthellaceae bacterium]
MSVGVLALLALLPIVLIFVLLIVFKVPTHWAAVIGWVVTVAIAMAFFSTSLEVALRSSWAGIVSSLGITLLIGAAVFQIGYMEETGAIQRITAFIKTLAPDNEAAQTMIVGNGAGTTLVSIGATPVAILPPIFKGLGYSDFLAVALPAIGFIGLDAYGMLAICMVAVSGLLGIDLVALNQMVVLFLPVVSTACAFAMLYLIGGWKSVRSGWAPALIAGLSGSLVCVLIAYVPFLQGAILLSGVIAGIVIMAAEMAYLKVRGYRLFDDGRLDDADRASIASLSLAKALSPWILMIIFLCATNFIPPLYDLLANQWACPVEVIPGSKIAIKPLWNAYTWAFVATILSAAILRPSKQQVTGTLRKFAQRAPKPMIAVCVFYALGILMNNTGMDPAAGWKIVDPETNMISVLAMASTDLFGALFPLIAAPLTVVGAFVTSSQTSACVMFAKYFVTGSASLGINFMVLLAIAVIAGGVASVISPAKLLNASATIGADGADREALRKVLAPTLVIIVICMILCFIACQVMPPLPSPPGF